jgi:hypothetical protein
MARNGLDQPGWADLDLAAAHKYLQIFELKNACLVGDGISGQEAV